MQTPHTFQYPKVTPVAQSGAPKPATPAAAPPPAR
jgi:hypothetical protein